MKDALKYALLAVGGFLLARQFGLLPEISIGPTDTGDTSGGGSDSGSGDSGDSGSGGDQSGSDTTTGDQGNNGGGRTGGDRGGRGGTALLDNLQTLAGSGPLNYHQWGYFYKSLTGRSAPGPYAAGVPAGRDVQPMTALQFLTFIGVSG